MVIQERIPLKDKNWFKTGGPARYFCEPSTDQEFQEALAFAQEKKLDLFFLGHGANIVVSDDGFDGLVVRPKTNSLVFKDNTVTAGAGVSMDDLIEQTLAQNLTGLEIFSDIPGTVGGSVYINLHYFEAFLSDYLISAQVINKKTGNLLTVDKAWFAFGYDQSQLMEKEYFLVNATFALTPATDVETAYTKGRRHEIIRHRRSRYPKHHTCGSFFRNFTDNEVHLRWEGKKMRFVAFYLDKIGVKGTESVGDACVSSKHANMLVNKGSATSQNIVDLARILQEKVKAQFDVIPQPECILVGFKEYPLLTQKTPNDH